MFTALYGQVNLRAMLCNEQLTLQPVMRIIVNAFFLPGAVMEEYRYYTMQLLTRAIAGLQEHSFVILADEASAAQLPDLANVKLILSRNIHSASGWQRFLNNRKTINSIQKNKAELLLSCDPHFAVRTTIPQLLFINNTSEDAELLSKKTITALKNATQLVTPSLTSKKYLATGYGIAETKTEVIPAGVETGFKPLSFEEKQTVKEQYTDGKEYFIHTGAIREESNIILLLKAFSFFKKRQKSSMKMVLAGNIAAAYKKFEEKLNAYKYREDVLLLENLEAAELQKLTAGAFALLSANTEHTMGLQLLNAMKSGTPVITLTSGLIKEITGENALYSEFADHEAIAGKMMLLYKDEALQQQLSASGRQVAAHYDWKHSAQQLKILIQNTVG